MAVPAGQGVRLEVRDCRPQPRGVFCGFQGPQASPALASGVIRQRSRVPRLAQCQKLHAGGGGTAGWCSSPGPGLPLQTCAPSLLPQTPVIHPLAGLPQRLPPASPRSVDSHALQHHGRCGGAPGQQQHCWRGPEGGAGVKAAGRGHLITLFECGSSAQTRPACPPAAPLLQRKPRLALSCATMAPAWSRPASRATRPPAPCSPPSWAAPGTRA